MRLLFALLLVSTSALAQPLTQTQKLISLAKLWGFLKYYHPAVAGGKLDWDGQLVRLIPIVQQTQDRQQLSILYERLLDELGSIKPCRKCLSQIKVPVENQRNLDLSFLTDSIVFSGPLRQRLIYVRDNRYQGDNYYGRLEEKKMMNVGNLSFENEKAYADITRPNNAYRLLALFRYWNIIHYFFPYKYAIDDNWNEVLPKLIPIFQQATTESAYQLALFQLIACIQDSHGIMTSTNPSQCLRCDLGRLWLPFEMRLTNNKAIITRLYNDSLTLSPLLRVGTVISHMDGETINARVERLRPYVSSSTSQALLRDLKGLIGVGVEKQVRLTLDLGGRDTTITAFRYPYQKLGSNLFLYASAHKPISRWLTDYVGYVNIGKLKGEKVDSVMNALLSARAIIFDLRNYPQGTYWSIGRYLVDKPTSFAQFTGPDIRFPGVFQRINTAQLVPFRPLRQYKGQVVVLINEDTQSQGEFTAMSFGTHPNVTFVGSPTAGADGNVSYVPLPGGYRTAFSALGVYYPDGRETQRIGIIPDIVVQPTVESIRQGRDEVMEQAMKLIMNK